MSNQSASQEVRDLARLTILSNRISETQAKNLKAFPLIFFNGIVTARVEYDLSSKRDADVEEDQDELNIKYKVVAPRKDTSVSYFLEIDPKADNSSLDKRFEALQNAVRTLFWNDLTVNVHLGEKLAYTSKK